MSQLEVILLTLVLVLTANGAPLTLTDGFTLDYELKDTDNDGTKDTIKMKLVSNTVGYLSIGFGSFMNNTGDYVMGWFENGMPMLADLVGAKTGFTPPKMDTTTQDVVAITAQCVRTASSTTLVFERQLNTGDSTDYVLKVNQDIPIIWAQGSADARDLHAISGQANFRISDYTKYSRPHMLTPGFTLEYGLKDTDYDGVFDMIKVKLVSNTVGYLSIGFGTMMSNTGDYVMGWFENGMPMIADLVGAKDGFKPPSMDTTTQDVVAVAAQCVRTASSTTLVFERQLNTGDSTDYVITTNTHIPLIWAQGTADARDLHAISGMGGFKIPDYSKYSAPVTLTAGFTLEYGLKDSDMDGVDDMIKVKLVSNTVGYLSIGFGTMMADTGDYVMGWFEGIVPYMVDLVGAKDGFKPPSMDATTNDIVVVTPECQRTASSTTLVFERKLNTGDPTDYVITTNVDHRLIWAQGVADPRDLHAISGPAVWKIPDYTKYSAPVTLAPGFTLEYGLKDADNDGFFDMIKIKLVSDTEGYLSIGFGTSMNNTGDYVMGWFEGGMPMIADLVGAKDGFKPPSMDTTTNDVMAVMAECQRSTGSTTLVFERQLNTGDSTDYVITTNTDIPIIWAKGSKDARDLHAISGMGSFKIIDYTKYSKPVTLAPGFTFEYALKDADNDGVNDMIQGKLVSNTQGYLSLGFGSSMNDTGDYVMGWFEGVVPMIVDLVGAKDGFKPPSMDTTTNDVVAVYAECQRSAGSTTLVFERQLNTGDQADYVITTNKLHQVIWAKGTADARDLHAISGTANFTIPDYTNYSDPLQLAPGFTLQYGLKDADQDGKFDMIKVKLVSNTEGYLSIGFGSTMANTGDYVMGWFEGGMPIIVDLVGAQDGFKPPSMDTTTNDVVAVMRECQRSQGSTTLVFERQLNTGDQTDYVITLDQDHPIIWAQGTADARDLHAISGDATLILGGSYGTLNIGFFLINLILIVSLIL